MIRRHVVGRRSLLLGAASIGALTASSARLAAQSSDVPAAAPQSRSAERIGRGPDWPVARAARRA
jgi:hypothetical protein